MDNEIKNQKLKEDIRKKLNSAEAELALSLLSEIEKEGGGEPDSIIAKNIGNKAYDDSLKQ